MTSRILIVDDEPEFLFIVETRLTRSGHEVITAENGMEALRKAEEEIPDLVILDIMMPGIDGYETLTRLKGEEKTKKIPVMMFSAKSQIEDIEKAHKLGACDYLVKSFDPKELLDRISKILRKT